MPTRDGLRPVFTRLKGLLRPYARHLTVKIDRSDCYYLDAAYSEKFGTGKVIFFGAVRLGKSYVSYHLIGVYASPGLVKGLSPRLKARMQGKACFNFTKTDPVLLKELAGVTKRSFSWFKKEQLL